MSKEAPEDFAAAQVSRLPQVAAGARSDRAGLLVGLSAVMLVGAATMFSLAQRPAAAASPPPSAPTALVPAPEPLPPDPAPVVPMAAYASDPAPLAPSPMPAPEVTPVATPSGIIFDATESASGGPPAATALAAEGAPRPPAAAQTLTPEEAFARQLLGEQDRSGPTRIANPATTVPQGALVSAVLETAIDSDTPGFVRALISRDVRSFDGSTVLIPRGSRVIGQYKSGLAVGQTRAYVLWTRLLRPDGVSIDIGSPGTDYAGRAGLTGQVDTHFVKRFGGALLLSVIGAAGQAIGGGAPAVVFAGPQQVAQASTQNSMAIPPTVRVPLGAPVRIFIARDLDFAP